MLEAGFFQLGVECSGRHLTPAGKRAKRETPQAERRGGSRRSPRKTSACSGMERILLNK